jgi:hypothetical protein
MPCLLAIGGLTLPRVVIAFLWIFTSYLERAFDSFLWPLLGFFFLPTTTLAWAWAENTRPGTGIGGVHAVIVVLALLLDLGFIGGGRSSLASRRRA